MYGLQALRLWLLRIWDRASARRSDTPSSACQRSVGQGLCMQIRYSVPKFKDHCAGAHPMASI